MLNHTNQIKISIEINGREYIIEQYHGCEFMTTAKEVKEDTKYLILGGGAIGLSSAKELMQRGKVLVVDIDEKKVNTLIDQGIEAVVGDAGDESLLSELISPEIKAVLILTNDVEVNKRAVEIVKKIRSDVYVVCRVDLLRMRDVEEIGADLVIVPSLVVAEKIFESIERREKESVAEELINTLKSIKGKFGIVLHDNPDPDAIGAGMALLEIAESLGIQADILYGGAIGVNGNRAFVNVLNLSMKHLSEVDITEYESLATVDFQPSMNTSLPSDAPVSIVIDHHEPTGVEAEFVDVRPEVGATSSILTSYLMELDIDISKETATALLYGIATDTHLFRMKVSQLDFDAVSYLMPNVDYVLISEIYNQIVSTETMDALATAIQSRKIKGPWLISTVGVVGDRNAISQAADYLINLEGILTVVVFGIVGDKIYVSARTKDTRVNMAELMENIFSKDMGGSAGGHAMSAGATIPLGLFAELKLEDKEELLKLVEEVIISKLTSFIGEGVREE